MQDKMNHSDNMNVRYQVLFEQSLFRVFLKRNNFDWS